MTDCCKRFIFVPLSSKGNSRSHPAKSFFAPPPHHHHHFSKTVHSMPPKTILVTGGNRGIGFAIACKLVTETEANIFITARDQGRADTAAKAINETHYESDPHVTGLQLDLSDNDSIDRVRDHFYLKKIQLDIVIHNAGMAYKVKDPTPFVKQVEDTLRCNYFGTVRLCQRLEPLLNTHARVVLVSSRAGLYHIITNRELRERFSKNAIRSIEDVDALMYMFFEAVKAGNAEQLGFSKSAYGMSKLGLTLAAFAMQKAFDRDPQKDLIINACCPGHVRTDMSSNTGNLSPPEGADTPVYLGLLHENVLQPKGEFVCERKVIEWC